jgi:hypothetical protein
MSEVLAKLGMPPIDRPALERELSLKVELGRSPCAVADSGPPINIAAITHTQTLALQGRVIPFLIAVVAAPAAAGGVNDAKDAADAKDVKSAEGAESAEDAEASTDTGIDIGMVGNFLTRSDRSGWGFVPHRAGIGNGGRYRAKFAEDWSLCVKIH